MVDLGVVVKYLGIASEAARTNWYGLGCPAFCYQPPLSTFVLIALLSFSLGAFLATYTLWTLFSYSLPSSAPPAAPVPNRYSALAGYLHERRSSARRRTNSAFSIAGPADQAADLLRYITQRGSGTTDLASSSEASFELVVADPVVATSTASPTTSVPVVATPVLETRDQILASFDHCPTVWLQGHQKLVGSSRTGLDRIQRAWRAGQWAKAVADGRIPTPNRTPPLDLKSRFYSVVRCPGLAGPTVFNSAGSYWQAIGDLTTSPSISHAFPSQTEARVYLAGAGIVDFEVLQ